MHLPHRAIQMLSLLLFAGIAQATPILDQQNAPSGNFPRLTVANDRSQIQTFTVGLTGELTRIDVQVAKGSNTVENLVLSLWSTDSAGLPKDMLASGSVPPSAIGSGGLQPPFVTFDLNAAALPVSSGELLAIVLDSSAPNNPPFFSERYEWEIGGQYDRGTAYTRLGSAFFAASDDFHFKTFVSVPEPSAWVILAVGLCGFYLRRLYH